MVNGAGATAVQISDVPGCVLARRTSVHARPAPETVNAWLLDPGPSDAAKATRISPPTAVLNGGVVSVPVPSIEMTRSTATSVEGGGPDEMTTATAEPAAACVPAVGF